MSGDLFGRDYWEERYRAHERHGSRDPSPHLVAEAEDLTPGSALEVGCGEGANAIWLATNGWRVSAVDISATALERARMHARAVGAELASRIEWVEADVTAAPPERAGFELVTSHYVHPAGPFEVLLRNLAEAVAPGGTLLVVGHDRADCEQAGHEQQHRHGATWDAGAMASTLDPATWEVQVAEARTRRDEGHGAVLHDAVLLARRRG